MPKVIEYFYDYVSPYSYLADTQLAGLLNRTGAELVYRPILLGGLHKLTGNRPPIDVPAKGQHMVVDLARWASHYDVPMTMNPSFPVFTLHALRGALVAIERDEIEAYHAPMFRAMWVDGLDISQPDVLGEVLSAAGLEPQAYLEGTARPAIKEALKANTSEAAERGVFGAPTFFVGDEMFWGNDRLAFVEDALS